MTYSIDFRIKVFEVKAREGFTYEETAKYFGIGKTTLVRDSLQLGAENHAKRSVEDGKFRPLRLRIAGKS